MMSHHFASADDGMIILTDTAEAVRGLVRTTVQHIMRDAVKEVHWTISDRRGSAASHCCAQPSGSTPPCGSKLSCSMCPDAPPSHLYFCRCPARCALNSRLRADAQEVAPWAKKLRQLQESQAPATRALNEKHGLAANQVHGPRCYQCRWGNASECLLPAAETATIEELYKDLQVTLRDGTSRQGAIRSVVIDKYFIVQMGAIIVLLKLRP